MKKKIPLLFLTLFSTVFAVTAKQVIADAPSLIEQADKLNSNKSYAEAKKIYQTIAKDYSHTEEALPAQRKLVCIAIALDDYQQAKTEFSKLITDFTGYEQLPKQIHEIGTNCRFFGKYEKAKYYYNYVIENFPDNPQAIFSQKDIVKTAIEAGDYTAEQQELDKLKTEFASNPDLPQALCSVADCYAKKKRYDKAEELNKYIVATFANSEYALRAQESLIKSYIITDDNTNMNTAIRKLSTDFIDHPGQWDAIKRIADILCDESEFDTVIGMYQYLIKTFPRDTDNVNWRKGIAIVKVNMADDAGAVSDVEAMIADFNDDPQLARAVFHVGEEYFFIAENYYKDKQIADARLLYRKALNIWEKVLFRENLKSFRYGQLYSFSAESYYRLGEYMKAVVCFQKVADDWPDYRYGTIVQYMIGECYEELKKSPDISIDDVDERIAKAYKAVIKKYPEKPLAVGAALKLAQLYFAKEQWSEAIVYFEMYRQKRPERYRILRMLGEAYEKMETNELAIEVYEQYLAIAGENDHFKNQVQQRLNELK